MKGLGMFIKKNIKIPACYFWVLFFVLFDGIQLGSLPGFTFPKNENAPVAFFSVIEQKKKFLEKLQHDQAEHDKNLSEAIAPLRDEIIKIEQLIDGAKYSLNYVKEEQEAALKNKKITVLSEIKQTLVATQDELKGIAEVFSSHIRITKDFIALQAHASTEERAAYSWQELREAQVQTGDLASRLEAERKKREDLNKQKVAEVDVVSSLQKRLEVHGKENAKGSSDDAPKKAGIQLKLANDIFSLESQLLQKKIELSRNKINRLELEIATQNDAVELTDVQLQSKRLLLGKIEKALNLTSYDVETARAETNLANQRAVRVKEAFTKKIEEKKAEKEKQVSHRASLQRQLKDYLGQENETPDSVAYHLLRSEIYKVNNTLQVLEREIDILTIRRELEDLTVQAKEIVAHDVDVRYKLSRGRADAGDLVQKFKNHKDIALSLFKKMKDKHEEVLKSYGDKSRALEDIKTIQNKISAIATSLFKNHDKEYFLLRKNLDDARLAVTNWFSLSQEYIAASTDYLARYEKILSQYSLILENLESHRSRFGLWKRSANALSLEDLNKAFAEGEVFIKHLFYEAPSHLNPVLLVHAAQSATMANMFNLLLLFAFFVSFIGLFHLFSILMSKIARDFNLLVGFLLRLVGLKFSPPRNEKSLFFSTILLGVLEFLHNHTILAGTWLFIYLHIVFNFRSIFSLLQPYALSYYIALFYLMSIPLFIFLVRDLLLRLKELNKKISFLLFPENFQDRLEILIAASCYTVAILIPLRQAAWHLLPHASLALTNLLFAMQITLLTLLPFFIFSKEHILYFLPDASVTSQWVKRHINTYYYPLIIFFITLFLLSRSFIGYGNLATFLSFSIPLTLLVCYGMLFVHTWFRKYAVFIFMKESEDEIVDKFEHAKTYYGFFVIFSFLFMLLLTAFVIARIWEFNVTIKDFWRFLSETMVVPIGVDKKLGFIQLVTLILFVAGGFFASSIMHRFVLSRLFDILRTEPGTQNTVIKIVHYITISMSILLGFIAIHLGELIWYIGTTVAVGLGFALKDILADYVAGFFVLIERPIEIGNYVRLDHNSELQGVVHKIDARTTTIMTRLNHSVIIANRDVIGKVIANWGKGRFAVGFEIRILVDYCSNIDEVKKVVLEVLQSNPVILRVPNIIVRIDDFEEAGIYFLARAFISARRVQEQWNIAAALREELFKAFKAKNINFGVPQRIIHVGSNVSGSPIKINFEQ